MTTAGEVLPPPSEQAPQPAPESEPAWTAERLGRGLDSALVAGVLLFAFLVASFPAGNSDFFLHVASGRLLAEGKYHFGEDPFAFTSDGAYWVNPSWLYDL